MTDREMTISNSKEIIYYSIITKRKKRRRRRKNCRIYPMKFPIIKKPQTKVENEGKSVVYDIEVDLLGKVGYKYISIIWKLDRD